MPLPRAVAMALALATVAAAAPPAVYKASHGSVGTGSSGNRNLLAQRMLHSVSGRMLGKKRKDKRQKKKAAKAANGAAYTPAADEPLRCADMHGIQEPNLGIEFTCHTQAGDNDDDDDVVGFCHFAMHDDNDDDTTGTDYCRSLGYHCLNAWDAKSTTNQCTRKSNAGGVGCDDGDDNLIVECLFADDDGDGLSDFFESCPDDAENDADGDSICGDVDPCPYDPENDGDSDELCHADDVCPDDPANDADSDGLCAGDDSCPDDPVNDPDSDGVCAAPASCEAFDPCPYDAGDDVDGDAICGDVDTCEDDANNDVDGDQVCADLDPCPLDPNDDDTDSDGLCDHFDDRCPNDNENDIDSDGICGDADVCPYDALNPDTDSDMVCDAARTPPDMGDNRWGVEVPFADGFLDGSCTMAGLVAFEGQDIAITPTNGGTDADMKFRCGRGATTFYCDEGCHAQVSVTLDATNSNWLRTKVASNGVDTPCVATVTLQRQGFVDQVLWTHTNTGVRSSQYQTDAYYFETGDVLEYSETGWCLFAVFNLEFFYELS